MMDTQTRQYIAIDLKSFYASVECVERGLDPLDACLVVADESRTDKTICLAVSPTLKSFGIGGRPRLFEVIRRVRDVNRGRGRSGSSTSGATLRRDPSVAVDYIVAPPRMALYLDYSARIYGIYLRHVAPEDIHVYSVDEVIIDATAYLRYGKLTARELARRMIRDVLRETGITATAGTGTNMYLCKVAMDIIAKKSEPDADGVRLASLDEMSYRRLLWDHRPLTDFWRVGKGIAGRLESIGIFTMGDIARCSINHENSLYSLFGVNAELLIDHAWGWEPVTMKQVKAYTPEIHSLSSGQVLQEPYDCGRALTVALEMTDALAIDMLDKGLVSGKIVLDIGYDSESLTRLGEGGFEGRVATDYYGRQVPFHAHGTINLPQPTCLSRIMSEHVAALYDRIVDRRLLVRRINITACNVTKEPAADAPLPPRQLDLFTDYAELERRVAREKVSMARERRRQEAVLVIKKRFGKNSILRGLNYADGATQRQRNLQIGGHKA